MKKTIGKTLMIKLPTGTVTIGPGTVPTARGSVKETSIKEVVSEMRKASKEGIFSSDDQDYGSHTHS